MVMSIFSFTIWQVFFLVLAGTIGMYYVLCVMFDKTKTATPFYLELPFMWQFIDGYIFCNSLRNSSMPITLTGGNLMSLSTSK